MRIPRRKSVRFAILLATLFLVAAVAGCLDRLGEQDEGPAKDDDDDLRDGDRDGDEPESGSDPFDPTPPSQREPSSDLIVHAGMEVDPQIAWAGEQVNFSGEESGVLEGEIVRYVFESGDGDETELDPSEQPLFTHTYDEGGIYVANLTVHAEGENDTAQKTANVAVFVQERHELPEGEIDAGYLILASDEENEHDYTTRFGATFFEVTLEVSDASLVGDAVGEAAFTGPDDEQYDVEEIAGGGTVELSGMFNLTNPDARQEHLLSVMLEEGEIEYSGEVAVYYGIDPRQHDLD